MRKMKFLLVAILISSIFPIAGCSWFGGTKDISPEAVLPQDVSFVIAIDHSNSGQVGNLKDLVAKIPDLGFFENVIQQHDLNTDSPYKYSDNKDILEGEWKMVFGVKFPQDQTKITALLASPQIDLGASGIGVYAAAKFSEADKVQEFLNKVAEKDKEKIQFVGDEKNPVWKVVQGKGEMLIVRYGQVFFLGVTDVDRQAVMTRINDGNGWDKSDKFTKNMKLLGEENLGYLFVDGKTFVSLYKAILAEKNQTPAEVVDVMSDIWAFVSCDGNGIRFTGKSYLAGDKMIIDKYYPDYKLSLVNKVPSKGVIFYDENPGFGTYLESFLKGVSASMNSQKAYDALQQNPDQSGTAEMQSPATDESVKKVSRGKGYKSTLEPATPNEPIIEPPVPETPAFDLNSAVDELLAAPDLYDAFLDKIVAVSGLEKGDIRRIFSGAYALSISDTGGYLPAVSFYLNVGADSIDNAKKIVSSAATYIDQVLLEMNKMLVNYGMSGVIKKEVKLVDGAAIQRIYLDWSSMPTQSVEQYNNMLGANVANNKVEIYYGVMNDGTFVLALYPDFMDDYGKDTIADSGYYKEIVTDAGKIFGRMVGFFRTEPLISLAGRYIEIAKKTGFTDPDLLLEYEKYSTLLSSLKYLFGSDVRDTDGITSSAYLKIQKVEFSDELKQKIQAQKDSEQSAIDAQKKAQEEGQIGAPTDTPPSLPGGL